MMVFVSMHLNFWVGMHMAETIQLSICVRVGILDQKACQIILTHMYGNNAGRFWLDSLALI